MADLLKLKVVNNDLLVVLVGISVIDSDPTDVGHVAEEAETFIDGLNVIKMTEVMPFY